MLGMIRSVLAYLSESAETSKNATTNPSCIFALGRGGNSDLHILHREALNFAHQTVGEVLAQR